jgi:preprotein translocase subunit SecY
VAWGLSLVFAFIQGLGSSYLILSFVKSDLSLYFWGPTIIFQLVVVSGLMAGTFLCVWIAQLITRYGVGNGFLIIFFAEFIQSFIHHLIKRSSSLAKLNLLFDQRVSIFFIAVVLIGAAIFLWKFIRRALTVPIKLNNDSLLRFEISPFPMGVTATGFGLSIITAIDQLLRYVESDFYPSAAVFFDSAYKVINDGWTCIAFECVFIVLLGRVFFSLFYSEIDFFGLEVESLPNHLRKNKKVLNKQFMKGLGVMVVGTALFLIPLDEKVGSVFSLVGFSTLVFSIAIIQDLWTQWKFWRFNGTGIEVLEMDNVHLSSYLNGLFKTEGITFYIQSYRYR